MRIRILISILVSLVMTTPVVILKPCPVIARNYVVQLTDPQDAELGSDLKSIAMRDDYDYLYIKMECWKLWDMLSSDCCIEIFLKVGGAKDPQYILAVLEDPNGFYGYIYNIETKEKKEVMVNFDKGKPLGIVQIDRKLIKMRNSLLSFQFYTSVLDDPGHYFDTAPDNQSYADYVPGINTEHPKLDVASRSVQPGNLKKNDLVNVSFDVMNKGEGSIDVTFKSTGNIKMLTKDLTLAEYETQEVKFIINTTNLESQYYTEYIELTSNFGNLTVEVTFFVYPEPKLFVSKLALDYGKVMKGEKAVKKVTFSNKANGPIKVDLTSNESWIILNKTSFEAQTDEISVSLSSRAMEIGSNKGKIYVTSNGGTAVIDISAELYLPVVINKTEFDFGEIDLDNPKLSPISFTLKNQASEAILVKMSCVDPWITFTPEVKLQIDETKTLQIMLKLDKIETVNQSYHCELTFEAKNDVFTVPVKVFLRQNLPKIIWLSESPQQKTLDGKVKIGKIWEQGITIKNEGGGTLDVSARMENPESMFQVFTTMFSLKKGETRDIKVKFDSTEYDPGIYKNVLIVESNGGNLAIPITVEVLPKTEIVIKLFIGKTSAEINSKPVSLDAPPYINKGATMVPLRFISEAFQAKIEWKTIGKGRIILTVPSKTIQLDIGVLFAFINNEKIPLQVPPEIKSGRTFVPLRFIAEGLGAKIAWNSSIQQITIFYIVEEK